LNFCHRTSNAKGFRLEVYGINIEKVQVIYG